MNKKNRTSVYYSRWHGLDSLRLAAWHKRRISLNALPFRRVIVTYTSEKNSIKEFSFLLNMCGFDGRFNGNNSSAIGAWRGMPFGGWVVRFGYVNSWINLCKRRRKIDVSWIPLHCWWPQTLCALESAPIQVRRHTYTHWKQSSSRIIHSTYHWMIAFLKLRIPLWPSQCTGTVRLLSNVLGARTHNENTAIEWVFGLSNMKTNCLIDFHHTNGWMYSG